MVMASLTPWAFKMVLQDKNYYVQLCQHIAHYRKAKGLTQDAACWELGTAQQTLAHYEGGHLRIAVALLATLANTLSVAVEELINETTATKKKRGPASTLQRQIEKIGTLPRAKQKVIIEMLNGVLQQSR